MGLKNDFEVLFVKYKSIISLKEFIDFNNQLNKIGYKLTIKRQLNNIDFNYEKPSVLDILKRSYNYIKNNKLKLLDYQKIIYKI